MSEFTTTEILERFNDGLRKASSRAREMYSIVQNPLWLEIAASLDGIRTNGGNMAVGKALTRTQVLDMLDAKKSQKINQETKH